MKRYLKRIQMGLALMVMALVFNNCSKIGFSGGDSEPSAKVQGDEVSVPGIEEAEVDKSYCENDNDGDDGDDGKGSCYALCHVPPGNHEAQHTIYVGRPALTAHLERHVSHDDDSIKDHAGECDENPDDDDVQEVENDESDDDVDAA